jgi:hypothetical protein
VSDGAMVSACAKAGASASAKTKPRATGRDLIVGLHDSMAQPHHGVPDRIRQ